MSIISRSVLANCSFWPMAALISWSEMPDAGQGGDQLVELVVDPFPGGQVDRLPEDATAFSRSSVLLDFSYRWASVSSDCWKAANSRRSRSWVVGRLLLVLLQVACRRGRRRPEVRRHVATKAAVRTGERASSEISRGRPAPIAVRTTYARPAVGEGIAADPAGGMTISRPTLNNLTVVSIIRVTPKLRSLLLIYLSPIAGRRAALAIRSLVELVELIQLRLRSPCAASSCSFLSTWAMSSSWPFSISPELGRSAC